MIDLPSEKILDLFNQTEDLNNLDLTLNYAIAQYSNMREFALQTTTIPNPSMKVSLIHLAARTGSLKFFQFLKSKGLLTQGDVNSLLEQRATQTSEQSPPLSFAAQTGQTAVVKYLLEQGADVNAKSTHATIITPLDWLLNHSKDVTLGAYMMVCGASRTLSAKTYALSQQIEEKAQEHIIERIRLKQAFAPHELGWAIKDSPLFLAVQYFLVHDFLNTQVIQQAMQAKDTSVAETKHTDESSAVHENVNAELNSRIEYVDSQLGQYLDKDDLRAQMSKLKRNQAAQQFVEAMQKEEKIPVELISADTLVGEVEINRTIVLPNKKQFVMNGKQPLLIYLCLYNRWDLLERFLTSADAEKVRVIIRDLIVVTGSWISKADDSDSIPLNLTAVVVAVICGHYDLVELLSQAGANLVDERTLPLSQLVAMADQTLLMNLLQPLLEKLASQLVLGLLDGTLTLLQQVSVNVPAYKELVHNYLKHGFLELSATTLTALQEHNRRLTFLEAALAEAVDNKPMQDKSLMAQLLINCPRKLSKYVKQKRLEYDARFSKVKNIQELQDIFFTETSEEKFSPDQINRLRQTLLNDFLSIEKDAKLPAIVKIIPRLERIEAALLETKELTVSEQKSPLAKVIMGDHAQTDAQEHWSANVSSPVRATKDDFKQKLEKLVRSKREEIDSLLKKLSEDTKQEMQVNAFETSGKRSDVLTLMKRT